MSQTGDQPEKKSALRTFNLALAAVTGQVGCLTIVIILAAFLAGRWLDNQFGSDALFTVILMVASVPVTLVVTVILMVASVPVTLVVMFWVVRSVTSRFAKLPEQDSKEAEEGIERGKTP
jgi:magnesium-transporting ATPase (P-type)